MVSRETKNAHNQSHQTYHRLIRNTMTVLLFTTHRKQKRSMQKFSTITPRSQGNDRSQGRFQIEQQTNALLFKIINPIAQIKSKIEHSKQSNILFTHYGKFRTKQSSSSIIQTWANNGICTGKQNKTSSTVQRKLT